MLNESNKEIAKKFLQLVAEGQVKKAYELYIGEDFVHHNAYFAAGSEALMRGMEESAKMTPNKQFTVKLTLEDGNKVMTYSHLKHKPEDLGVVVVHIVRIDNGKIVEMWDVGQAIPQEIVNTDGIF